MLFGLKDQGGLRLNIFMFDVGMAGYLQTPTSSRPIPKIPITVGYIRFPVEVYFHTTQLLPLPKVLADSNVPGDEIMCALNVAKMDMVVLPATKQRRAQSP